MTLPRPTDFNEGQRSFFGLMMVAAGVCFGLAALAAGALIMWGGWPAELARLRLLLIGAALGGSIVGTMIVTVAMALGGPVGRFKVAVSKDSASIEGDRNDAA